MYDDEYSDPWNNQDPEDPYAQPANPYVPPPTGGLGSPQTPTGVPGNQWGIGPNPGSSEDRDLWYWLNNGVTPTGNDQSIFDANGQLRPGWKRTARGYERDEPTPPTWPTTSTIPTTIGGFGDGGFGSMQNPNEGFVWPTLTLPRANYSDFQGFKPFKAPTPDEILNDPVLQAQLKEGNNRIKQDRAFRGILNTGSTLKDIFDWTSDRIKLGGNDAFDRAFKVYDVNERQNPFNTWSANKDKYFQEFNTNLGADRDEFLYNQYNPAKALWDQNYNVWKSQGDWLSQMAQPPA